MTIRKPEFKGVRKQCERCEDLWPHMDIAENGQCPKCLQETQTITSDDVGSVEDLFA